MVFNGKMYITNCKYARAFVLFIPAAQSIFHSIFFSKLLVFLNHFRCYCKRNVFLKSNFNCRWCWWWQRRPNWLRGLRWWRWRYPRLWRWGPSRLWRWERRIVKCLINTIDNSKLLLSRHFYMATLIILLSFA